MKCNSVIDILFDRYLERGSENHLEKIREKAFSKIDSMVEENADASSALIEYQDAAMRAAFYEGFSMAVELFTGKKAPESIE